ncbi:class I SAM-dependent methyltransferase [Flagellimonas algicola]|uniref:class I SAM-dependent methyltransferase n=1 Tax=Flagellimonas algicola TaxID=2583815 RepID=UPI0028BF4198|nr:class I SAM-dependent methyltransferase [Allomuricauda algicola]
MSVLLNKPLFDGISQKELVIQLEAKKKCREKLPIWFQTPNIYYPPKLHIEQTSSEQTAMYKADLIQGKKLLDLTGGLGVDSFYFSSHFESVFHCEMDSNLSEISEHNFKALDRNNITCIPGDGLEFLKTTGNTFDWIFVDPSRRNDKKGKVFLLEDCLPNLPKYLPLLFEKASRILIKTSPLLDLKQGIQELKFVKEIHVVAAQNEVKELLYVLEQGYASEVEIKTVNLFQDQQICFDFNLQDEQQITVQFGKPQNYLYEPNAAILKSGGFKSIGKSTGVQKLHQHSHLYTSEKRLNFPGRAFKIGEVLPYSKSGMKSFSNTKANVSTRNFPLSVAELRRKHKIKDGGETYLFFTTDKENKRTVIVSQKCN